MQDDEPQQAGSSQQRGFQDNLTLPNETCGIHGTAPLQGIQEQLATISDQFVAVADANRSAREVRQFEQSLSGVWFTAELEV